ncbi:MAG TPA: HD domain-containing phosphohydrolase [Anaerolineales bacterium]|nr:HD domain-containing phosphohydrolase [Anaerolineales bacterium]
MNQTDEILNQSLLGMAVVAEYALPDVDLHVQRIREYVYVMGRALDMEESEAAMLADASQLHDIGMVSVPVAVVRKATNLTNDEWDMVRCHPDIGSDLLRRYPHEIFQLAGTIALSHHERWDGSGYPLGLMKEDIPLAGRICGLCDVFDTLTHPRAYKRALMPDEVLLLLQESSESFFDPRLVEAFIRKFDEIVAVRNRYQRAKEPTNF